MCKLSFNNTWIYRIMTCVSTITYSVLVNGQPLRQGDPISSYFYLIYAKGLSTILHDSENSFKIRGVRVARNSPPINYLFFADDDIVFCIATIREWNEI